MKIEDTRKRIAAEYISEMGGDETDALAVIFATKHTLRLSYDGYAWYKEKKSAVRVELKDAMTAQQVLYLHRSMTEPFLIVNTKLPVLLMFDEKNAAMLLLMNNDLEKFIQTKKRS